MLQDLSNHSLYDSDAIKSKDEWKQWLVDTAIRTARPLFHKSGAEINNIKNVISGNMDRDTIIKLVDPTHISKVGDVIDAVYKDIPKYPILKNIINALVGDYILRPHDVKAVVINPEAISRKEELQMQMLKKFIEEKLQSEVLNKDELTLEIQKLQNDVSNMQTINEVAANEILNELKYSTNIDEVLKQAFTELVQSGSEVLHVRTNYEPEVVRVPISDFYISGVSNVDTNQDLNIQNADIIVFKEYMNMTEILKMFGDEIGLDHDILKNNNGLNFVNGFGSGYTVTSTGANIKNNEDMNNATLLQDMFEADYNQSLSTSPKVARLNTALVYHTYSKVPRKVGKLWYPIADGSMQYSYVDGNVKADKSKGQTIEYFYVPEIWEGHKIGNYYFKIRVYPVAASRMDDPSYCCMPFAGRLSVNSIIDDVLSYAVTYTLFILKLNHLWVTNIGKVMTIDKSSIPEGAFWTPDKFMELMHKYKIAYYDSFRSSSTGVPVGMMQQKNSVIDLSLGNEISECIQMLDYLSNQIQSITGVSPQRLGQTKTTDGLGVVQQSITQSTKVTEYIYNTQECIEKDFYNVWINHARVHYADKGVVKKQYSLSDASIRSIEFEGGSFSEDQYNISIITGTELQQLKQKVEQWGHAAIQNGQMNLSTLVEISMVNSPSVFQTKLKEAERNAQQSRQQEQQQQQQMQEANNKAIYDNAKMQLELDMQKMELAHKHKMEELMLQIQGSGQNALALGQLSKDTATEVATISAESKLTTQQNKLSNK